MRYERDNCFVSVVVRSVGDPLSRGARAHLGFPVQWTNLVGYDQVHLTPPELGGTMVVKIVHYAYSSAFKSKNNQGAK